MATKGKCPSLPYNHHRFSCQTQPHRQGLMDFPLGWALFAASARAANCRDAG